MEKLRSHRATVDGLSRGLDSLPVEIVGEIFAAAAHDDYGIETTLSISATDRKWRAIALATPALWARVMFDEETNYSLDLLAIFLERSMAAPLTIKFDAPENKTRIALPILLNHAHRWLSFEAETDDLTLLLDIFIQTLPHPATLPMLESFIILHSSEDPSVRYLPPIHFPAILDLHIPDSHRNIDFNFLGSQLKDIFFTPMSLAGLGSCVNLRNLRCNIQADMVMEQNLRLSFPRLEELELYFDQSGWPLVSRLFQAMVSCTPRRLEMGIRCYDSDTRARTSLNPPATLLSRVEHLTVRVTGDVVCSPINRSNVEQILEKCYALEEIDFSNMPEMRLLLRRMTKTFPPKVASLSIRNGGALAAELRNLLVHRRKEGKEPLEALHLVQCGKRTEQTLARFEELVEYVSWDEEDIDDEDDEYEK